MPSLKYGKEDYISESKRIADYLIEKAITGVNQGEEDYCWISTNLEGTEEIIWNVAPVNPDLYNGNAGIALFFTYLAEYTGDSTYKRAAEKALVPLKVSLQNLNREYAASQVIDIGAFSGISGCLYTLSHIAKLWDDQELLNLVVDSIPSVIDSINNDKFYDLIGGAAGTLGVLLEIYEDHKVATRQHDSLTGTYVQTKLQFQTILDQVFPEYKGVFGDLYSKVSLNVLLDFPTPKEVEKMSLNDIAKKIHNLCKNRSESWAVKKAEKLKAAARNNPYQQTSIYPGTKCLINLGIKCNTFSTVPFISAL